MDTDNQNGAKADPRAQRARTILLVVMAVFIVAPVILYILVTRGAAPGP
jgi:hypothetical protein